MTETGMLTSNPYDGDRIAGTVGLPLPGVEVRIANPQTGALLPDGEIGVVEVKGPNVFKGYWRMPEKTAAEFRADGFFITGDLGRIDERGYLHIVGRGKDLIVSGGFNVYPKEVEGEIDALPGVLESAVIGCVAGGNPVEKDPMRGSMHIAALELDSVRLRNRSCRGERRAQNCIRNAAPLNRFMRKRRAANDNRDLGAEHGDSGARPAGAVAEI